jgi:hypothetical protein
MRNDSFDAETNMALSEAEALEAMFQSAGWIIAQRAMDSIVSACRDARNVDIERPDASTQIKVNLAIADNLEEWVNDLRGRVNNAIIMKSEPINDSLITRR